MTEVELVLHAAELGRFRDGELLEQAGDGQGAGLGLSLARRLARSVDGDVIADAAAGGGRFLVRLPSG